MSLAVLAQGTLVSDPQERTSQAGKRYATALLRVPVDGEEAALVSCIAFAPAAVEALLAHAKGDLLAVTGRAKVTSWEKDGCERHGLSVTVEGVLSAYQLEKRRSRARGEPEVALQIQPPRFGRPPRESPSRADASPAAAWSRLR